MFGRCRSLTAAMLLSLGLALLATVLPGGVLPASAQEVLVQNGGAVEVANGALLDLEDGQMNLGTTATLSEQSGGRAAGGTLTATRALNSPSSADLAGLGAVLTSSADLGEVTVTRGHVAQTGGGNASIERYYRIEPSQNNAGLSAELTFTYHDDELNGLAESDLQLFKSEDGGANWSLEGADSRSTGPTGGNTVGLSGIASFSRWTLGSESSPLPVELAGFEAAATGGGARLTWQTVSETGSAGFEVQRKRTGGPASAWKQVGYVESKASGGSATEPLSYEYVATGLPIGTHRFRLRQVDLDGSSAIYGPVDTRIRMEEPVKLTAPAPNPVSESATTFFAVKKKAQVTIRLYNALGQRVSTLYDGTPQPGERQSVQVEASGLPSGAYFLRLKASGKTETRRLTVVR